MDRVLDSGREMLGEWLDESPRSPRWVDGHLTLADEERARRYARLPTGRRAWAHQSLAEVLDDPVERARHACLAGTPRIAWRRIEEAVEAGIEDPAREADLYRAALTLPLSKRRLRVVRVALAKAAWKAGLCDEAEKALEDAGATRSRDPAIRLLRAEILNRRGRLDDATSLTRSLLRRGELDTAIDYGAVLDLHARNLLLLGRADDALRVLDRHLLRPGPRATREELNLHLTRQRCAREAGCNTGYGSRLLDLARVVREGRRRNDGALEARAAWHLAIALSDSGSTERALHWLAHARGAWLDRGDTYRAAEVENSLAIFLHKLGKVDEATSVFELAIERLERLNEQQSVAIVRMNLADLKLDLLELPAARRALSYCRRQLGQGVLGFKSELMTLECHLLAGAAPDLLLERLEELGQAAEGYERPAVHAYYHKLRGRILRRLGRVREACLGYEEAATLYDRAGNATAASEMLVWLAALQHDVRAARTVVAKALWSTRHAPPAPVRAASRVLRGAIPPLAGLMPLESQRIEELIDELRVLCRGDGEHTADPIEPERCLALAELMARTVPGSEPPHLARFCDQHLGAPQFLLLRRGPVGSFERVAGSGIRESVAFREARGIVQDDVEGSLCVVESQHWLFAIAHAEVELRFGHREHEMAKRVLALLELREAAGTGQGPDSAGTTSADDSPHRYAPDGVSAFVQRLKQDLPAIARSQLPIVVEGDTGTGKDRLARYIHHLSHRSAGPFSVLDCSALHATLAESELLGYAKGAFTGADRSKPGILERASGGTLVLDEPAALPQRAQLLLVRALETQSVRRLGDLAVRPIDVRVIALARTPLETALQEGTVRPDLFYRLHGTRVALLPLLARREDLPVLLSRMIEEENAGRPRAVTPEALAALTEESWPGNLTELRNRTRRALLLAPSTAPLGPSLIGERAGAVGEETPPRTLTERLRAEERRALAEALSHNGGHRTRTALQLGISRRWLQKRIKELGVG